MGKIILEFDAAEEEEDARTALDGYKWKLAMWDLDQTLRSVTKYRASIINEGKQASEEEFEMAEKMREEIRGILSHYNIMFE